MNELTKLLITFHESMNKLDADRKAVQLAMTENDIEKLVWNAAIDAPKFDELWDEHSEHIGDNRVRAWRRRGI